MKNTNKKNNMWWYFFGLAVFIIIIIIPTAEWKYCFVEHSTENSVEATYKYFKGSEDRRFNLDEGEILVLDYNSTVEKGELEIYIKSPTGKIVAEIEGGTAGTEKITADTKGRYRLIIEGERTRGEYSLQWELLEEE